MLEYFLFTLVGVFFFSLCEFIKRFIRPVRGVFLKIAALAALLGLTGVVFAKLKCQRAVNN